MGNRIDWANPRVYIITMNGHDTARLARVAQAHAEREYHEWFGKVIGSHDTKDETNGP